VRVTQRVPVAHGWEDYREVSISPLACATTVAEVQAYARWPSPDWFDYSEISDQCEAIRQGGRVAVFVGDRLNRVAQLKPAMYIRGVEQILLDMALSAELAHAVIGRIRAFCAVYLQRILEAARGKLDIVLTGDDFGAQQGPLVSPRMWVDYLGEGFAQFVSLAHQAGVLVAHHTCGSVRRIVPLMVERGLDILQSLQPDAADMSAEALKSEFGHSLAFHGGISIQRTLPLGCVDDIRREVADRVSTLGRGGGYIACTAHNIQADTPPDNAIALLNAYHELGRY
jgi:uroporphyrinogen decarboxylase